jgi:hypothetical protein
MKKKIIIVSLIVISLTLIPAVVLANTIYGNFLIGKSVNAHLYMGMQGVSVYKLIGTTNGGLNSTIPTIILFTGIIILVIVIFAIKEKKHDH